MFSAKPFQGCKVSITGFSAKERDAIASYVRKGGGDYSADLVKSCTHLIARQATGTGKCKAAKDWGAIHIVSYNWIKDSHNAGQRLEEGIYELHEAEGGNPNTDSSPPQAAAVEAMSSARPFQGCKVSITGFPAKEREAVAGYVREGGGEYFEDLLPSCTHLIARQATGTGRCKAAKDWGAIRIVSYNWVEDSHNAGQRLEEGLYELHEAEGGNPNTDSSPPQGPSASALHAAAHAAGLHPTVWGARAEGEGEGQDSKRHRTELPGPEPDKQELAMAHMPPTSVTALMLGEDVEEPSECAALLRWALPSAAHHAGGLPAAGHATGRPQPAPPSAAAAGHGSGEGLMLLSTVYRGEAGQLVAALVAAALGGALGDLQERQLCTVARSAHGLLAEPARHSVLRAFEQQLRGHVGDQLGKRSAGLRHRELLQHMPPLWPVCEKLKRVRAKPGAEPWCQLPGEPLAGQLSVRVRSGCSVDALEVLGVYGGEAFSERQFETLFWDAADVPGVPQLAPLAQLTGPRLMHEAKRLRRRAGLVRRAGGAGAAVPGQGRGLGRAACGTAAIAGPRAGHRGRAAGRCCRLRPDGHHSTAPAQRPGPHERPIERHHASRCRANELRGRRPQRHPAAAGGARHCAHHRRSGNAASAWR